VFAVRYHNRAPHHNQAQDQSPTNEDAKIQAVHGLRIKLLKIEAECRQQFAKIEDEYSEKVVDKIRESNLAAFIRVREEIDVDLLEAKQRIKYSLATIEDIDRSRSRLMGSYSSTRGIDMETMEKTKQLVSEKIENEKEFISTLIPLREGVEANILLETMRDMAIATFLSDARNILSSLESEARQARMEAFGRYAEQAYYPFMGINMDNFTISDKEGNILFDFRDECKEELQKISDLADSIRAKMQGR
jgi:hypothetical protein